MDTYESESTEFKREMGMSAIKSIIAFANTSGGTVLIGVADDGRPVGIRDIDAELTRVTSMMRDSIRPDILMQTMVEVEELEGLPVIAIHVGRGVQRPYYLASKGPRPQGAFVRSGAASVPASEAAILSMIRESESDRYETRSSMRQDLTFEYAAQQFAIKNLALGKGEMRTLGLIDAAGVYTNLALLLSDQCPPTIKAALFADDERTVFLDREEFEGSILKQLNGAFAFLEKNNHYVTSYQGLNRIDNYDYPAVALREALVNSVAHREYALSGPTLVSVLPSCVEITSLGGLPAGLEYADLSSHISMPRNKDLANVFFRLELIEAYGTGMARMRESYPNAANSVRISVTPNSFTVVLPNVNAKQVKEVLPNTPSAEDAALLALRNGATTRAEVQEALGISQTTAGRLLANLQANNLVTKTGKGKSTRYFPR